ncbi:MAG: ABC transporter permease [Chloroflexi bacterium]|nr:ABC transporter permease [Chloroflexota bacterium]
MLSFQHPGYWLPAVILLGLVLLAPLVATHDPIHATPGRELEGPSADHWLGTDRLGRDVWSRLVIGGRRTITGGFLATGIAIGIGTMLGGFATVGPYLMRETATVLIDALLAFPAILLALVVRTALEGSLVTLSLAIGVASIAPYARVTISALNTAALQPHIEGAQSIGASQWRVLTRHIVPGALPTLLSFASVVFAWSMLYGAALAFLGLGGNPSAPDWGIMIAQGRGVLTQAPQLVLLPGGFLALTVWLAEISADAFSRPIRR